MIAVSLKDYLQVLIQLQYCGKQYPLVLKYPTAVECLKPILKASKSSIASWKLR